MNSNTFVVGKYYRLKPIYSKKLMTLHPDTNNKMEKRDKYIWNDIKIEAFKKYPIQKCLNVKDSVESTHEFKVVFDKVATERRIEYKEFSYNRSCFEEVIPDHIKREQELKELPEYDFKDFDNIEV